MPVEVVVAWQDTVVDAITANGQIEPIQSIQLRPEVDGRLVDILAREGAEVARGTPLFKIDDGELFPVAFAVLELTPAAEKRIAELVKKAVS